MRKGSNVLAKEKCVDRKIFRPTPSCRTAVRAFHGHESGPETAWRPALLTFLLGLLLQACVVLPIPLDEDKVLEGRPITESQLSFMRPGSTTREEVVHRFGQPYIIWADARIFIYRWEMRQGILIWAVASNREIIGDAIDIPRHCLLLIAFDGNNVVTRFERVTRPASRPAPDFLMDWLHGTRIRKPEEQ